MASSASIFDAVANDDLRTVELLLSIGRVDVDEGDCDGTNCLMLAASLGKLRVLQFLKASGASVQHRNSNGWTALHAAAHSGSAECAAALVTWGAKLTDIDHQGRTPVFVAFEGGHVDVARVFLSYDVSLSVCDAQGTSPVVVAARNGNRKLLELVAQHTSPNASVLCAPDDSGCTALVAAAASGQADIIDFFASNAHLASCLSDSVVWWPKTLVQRFGGDRSTKHRCTALHAAVAEDHGECVRALVMHGADVEVLGPGGLTPMRLAAAFNRHAIMDIMRQALDARVLS